MKLIPLYRKLKNFRAQPESTGAELLVYADPEASVAERAEWLVRILRWMRSGDRTLRLKFLLQCLENNSGWHASVGATLRSILRDADALSLFVQTGFTLENSLLSELQGRMIKRLLPTLPRNDLAEMLARADWDEHDASWIQTLDPELWRRLGTLFRPAEGESNHNVALARGAKEAQLLLGSAVAHHGLAKVVRDRHALSGVEGSPFLNLQGLVLSWGALGRPASPEAAKTWEEALGLCRQSIKAVKDRMDSTGVSVGLVYRLELILASLQRMDDLVLAFSPSTEKSARLKSGIAKLIADQASSRGLGKHLSAHLDLLSQKIAERNGTSGGHYLAQSGTELRHLFWSALGGGFVVVLLCLGKLGLHAIHLPPLLGALGAWVIYSAGFLLMQFSGFTLATKLPSFLAANLAHRLASARGRAQSQEIVDDFKASFTSQGVALLGNLAGLIPIGLALTWALSHLFGISLFSPEEAQATLTDAHPYRSLAIALGALTGAELWISSLAGGWFENWLVFHRVPEAIAAHPRLRAVLGSNSAQAFGAFVDKHSSGVAANLALGFLFGFVPLIGIFIGVNTESRHVTIASTQTLLAMASPAAAVPPLRLALEVAAGLLCIGLMNFLVSFSLSLSLAARAIGLRHVWRIGLGKMLRAKRDRGQLSGSGNLKLGA